jgi:hypothetical protein
MHIERHATTCPTCDGHRFIGHLLCPDCEGNGKVIYQQARKPLRLKGWAVALLAVALIAGILLWVNL